MLRDTPSTFDIRTTPHYELLKRQLPGWMEKVHPDLHAAIKSKPLPPMTWYEKAPREMPDVVAQFQQAHRLHRHDSEQVNAIMARIPSPEAFARPLLEQAIKRRFDEDIDSTQTFLFNAQRVVVPPTYEFGHEADVDLATFNADRKARREQAMHAATSTLLQAAMQNFEAKDAERHGMDNGDLKADIYMAFSIDNLTISGTPVGIPAHAFAQLCRELDLGQRYQERIQVALNWTYRPGDAPDSALANSTAQMKLFERSSLLLQTHIAYMKGDIDPATHEDMIKVAHNKSSSRCHSLRLFKTVLKGIILVRERSTLPDQPVRVTAYIPDDPFTPLKTYPSVPAFVSALRANLFKPGYLQFLARFVPARERATLFHQLDTALHPKAWDNANQRWVAGSDPDADIKARATAFEGFLLEELVRHKVNTLKDDALFHLVTTEAEDRKSQQEHADYLKGKFFMALNVAAFFVPGLGEALLVMTAVELCWKTIEGFESLLEGDKEAAIGHFLGVAENVAMLAAFAGAGYIASQYVLPKVIGTLKQIPLPNGVTRLWKPDIAPYQHEVELPASARPDNQGLYNHEGKQWLKRDDGVYCVKAPEDGLPYRLAHPGKAGGYEPPLRTNGKGSWISEADTPHTWQGPDLFRKLGPVTDGISDTTAGRIMRVSDTHEATLRLCLAEAEQPPALLEDTLQRFKLDQDLDTVITQLEAQQPPADPQLLLQLLAEHPRWPTDKALRLESPDGRVIRQFTAARDTTILVHDNELDALQVVLDSLHPDEVSALLGSEPGPYARLILRQQLLENATTRRTELFNRRYQATQATTDPLAALIRARFPDLPVSVAEELAAHANPAEQALMRDASVPPRLADEARAYQAKLRVNRAYEGVYLDSINTADSTLLQQHTAASLPGWSATQPAPIGVVREASLPPRRKVQELLQMAPDKPGAKSPMELADGRAGMPVSETPRIILEESLLDKIRLLELEAALDTDAPGILDQLYAHGLDRAAIDQRLNQLFDEQRQLQAHLDQWALDSASQHLSPARQLSRQRIGDALQQFWRTSSLPHATPAGDTLSLEAVYLDDFPADLPSFVRDRVQHLDLRSVRPVERRPSLALLDAIQRDRDTVEGFFAQFTHVTAVSINEGGALGPYSLFSDWTTLIASRYPQLTELRLVNLRLPIGSTRLREIRSLAQLRHLDLSGNRFYEPLDFSNLNLDYLGLDSLSDEWSEFQPDLFSPALLDHTAEISLRGNRLLALPDHLLENPTGTGRSTRLVLTDNRLNRETLRTAIESEQPGGRYTFDTDLPRASVEASIAQQRELQRAVADWRDASSSSAPPSETTLTTRRTVSHAITQFWRTLATDNAAPVLALNGASAAEFPHALPAFFYREVLDLQLNEPIASSAQLNQLLRDFPQLERLTIDGTPTPLPGLPAALLELPSLRSLNLIDQGLVIDQAAMDFFADIPELQHLSLDGNTLGTITEVSALRNRNLDLLSLERMGISAWPQWLDSLIPDYLGRVNLRDNGLIELPEYLLENHRRETGHTTIELRGNPLDHETMRRAHVSESYYRPFAFEMDLPDDIAELTQSDPHSSDTPGSNASQHSAHSPGLANEFEAPTADPWLPAAAEQHDSLRQTWETLQQGDNAPNLLNLIERLRQTADYRSAKTRPELAQRVWTVLEQAAADDELCLLLNGMAEEPLQLLAEHATCPDGIRLAFNQMEVQVFIRQATRSITGESRGPQLQQLVRRLFRLSALDDLAMRNAGARDQAEVRLAYRLQLAQDLDLPIPPSRMLYEGSADLRPGELNLARSEVGRSEQGQPFLDFAADQAFWTQYLREAYAERFQAVRNDYEAQVLALTDRYPDETMEQIGERIKKLDQQLLANERKLVMQLTNQQDKP